MKNKPVKISIGDIFTIPFKKEEFAYVQIVEKTSVNDCFILFELTGKVKKLPSLSEIIDSRILYLVYSVDTRIRENHWKFLGNISVPTINISKEFIIDSPNGLIVNNNLDIFLRQANEKDIKTLKTFSSYSPSVLEKIVEFQFGNGRYFEYFEDLKYK